MRKFKFRNSAIFLNKRRLLSQFKSVVFFLSLLLIAGLGIYQLAPEETRAQTSSYWSVERDAGNNLNFYFINDGAVAPTALTLLPSGYYSTFNGKLAVNETRANTAGGLEIRGKADAFQKANLLLMDNSSPKYWMNSFRSDDSYKIFYTPDGTNTWYSPLTIEANSPSNTLYLKNNGNVGIGTATPAQRLTVQTPSNYYGLYHTDGTTSMGTWVGGGVGWLGTGTANAPLYFFTANQGAQMALTPSGNTGIGTTSPGGLLHVAQNDGAGNAVRAPIILSRYWPSASDTRASSIFHYSNSSVGKDQLVFGVSGDGGSASSPASYSNAKMVIQADGNVGIGRNTPNARLDVANMHDPGSDGLAIGGYNNNVSMIQSYIDGHWADRSTYAGGCCNTLLLQPDVGSVGIGTNNPQGKFAVGYGNGDQIIMYQPFDDTLAIQTTLNGQPNNGYGGHGANRLILQPVVGRVGIKQSNPQADLHIKQSTDSQYTGGILLENVAGNLAPIFLGGDQKLYLYSGSSGGYIRINTGGGVENVSSRDVKENYTELDFENILNKIDQLSVMEWNFKSQDPSIKHIGPFAEDFYSIFGLNDDNKTINAPDAVGVTMAGVKALSQKVKALESENASLKERLDRLEKAVELLQNHK